MSRTGVCMLSYIKRPRTDVYAIVMGSAGGCADAVFSTEVCAASIPMSSTEEHAFLECAVLTYMLLACAGVHVMRYSAIGTDARVVRHGAISTDVHVIRHGGVRRRWGVHSALWY